MITETQLDTIGFRVSTQELLYVLDTLGLKTLPSLGPDPLQNVPTEQKQQILAAGLNALRAREWAKITTDPEHPIVMDSLFVTPFLVCAGAQKIMSLTKQHREQVNKQVFLFQTPDVLVSHRIPEPGVHEFVMTSVKDKLAKLTVEFLDLVSIPAPAQPMAFGLPARFVNGLMSAISNRDLPQMEKILLGAGNTKPSYQSLLECLKNLKQTVVILMADFPEKITSSDQVSGRTISILSSDKLAWQIENNAQNDLRFSQIGPDEAKKLVADWAGSLANPPR